jgi:hypothetical protein
MTAIQPEQWVEQAARVVEFYQAASGATVTHRVGDGDDIVAQLAIGDAAFWVTAAAPELGMDPLDLRLGWAGGRHAGRNLAATTGQFWLARWTGGCSLWWPAHRGPGGRARSQGKDGPSLSERGYA